MQKEELEGLLEWATPKAAEAIKAIIAVDGAGNQAAADSIGMSKSTLSSYISKTRAKAARGGYAPSADMTKKVPPGYYVKGISTNYNAKGELVQQWVKTNSELESRTELILEAIETISEPFRGTSENPPKPTETLEDLLCVYPMGDPHLGMLACAEETGADFDLAIAESNLVEAVDKLVTLAPAAKQALIINLGDFFHSDNQTNRTARSGHQLDVDSRWFKIMRIGIRVMRRIIDKACEKHETVKVISAIGNHDDHSAVMLSLSLDQYYENNPRVEIDISPQAFHWHRFGVNLIGVHHGNLAKAADLPGIMAYDRKKDWGETKNHCRWFYCGHIHHDTLKEFRGVTVETFRTLAAKDAYAASNGYRAGRDMKCDVIHRNIGKTNRYIVGVEQLLPPQKD